ncbi:hypothetical protein CHS0354_037777 [Potamilus streckersoni]|uniref:MMS19 nucleotide excision repair protein n=1 Tax=Potamilus streckersoni TaxID=2493646 RepID=A0AAE0W6M7_9BIVA|nr:hypothetical protein CHS0354_037777 [Potamilus streckersoni]
MAAPLFKNAVTNFVNDHKDSASTEVANGILKKEQTLLELVESLGEYLTSTETSTRARATRLLADVLSQLPFNLLSTKEAEVLTAFFCEKLQDHHSIQPPSLKGLVYLSNAMHLSNGCAETICRTIFRYVHNQSLSQSDRWLVYSVISNFLHNRLQELQSMQGDFVYGFIQAMDAEKDPRNLILAFRCARIVAQNFPISVFAEELFEVTACYFPIDFSPPPNDPFGIKKEDLILGLRGCLSASPKFAEFCLPLLVEKLTSDIVSAKIDSLQTLTACSEVYYPDSLREFQSTFFDCIKKEVFYSGDATLEAASLDCFKALVKALSRGISQQGDRKSLDDFLNEIVNECQQHFLKPELKMMLLTGRLVCAAASGSETSCCRLVHVCVPLLLEQASKCTLMGQRKNVFEVLSWFITVTAEFQFGEEDPNPLVMYKDSFLSHYILLLSETKPQLQVLAATCVRKILSLTGILSETDIDNIADNLFTCVMQTTVADVRQSCYSALSLLSSSSPHTVISRVLPELVSRLNTYPMDADGEPDTKILTSKAFIRETMASIASHPLVIEKVSYQLISHLQSSHSMEKERNLEELCHTAKCLFQVVSTGVSHQNLLGFFHSNLLPAIYDFAISLCKEYCPREDNIKIEDLLSSLACSIRAVVMHLDKIQLETLLNSVVKLYLDGSCEDMKLKNLPQTDKFRPLQVEWNEYSPMVTLLTSVLCAVPTHVCIPRETEILHILTQLIKSWCSSRYPPTALYKLLAGLVNKLNNEELLQKTLDNLQDVLNKDGNVERGCLGVVCHSWITKALVTRGHKSGREFTEKLIKFLADADVGKEASCGFEIIVTEYDDIMTKSLGANVRMMYKQRFFVENIALLTEGFQSSQPEVKSNYLKAVSHLLKGLPVQVLMTELPKTFPLLVKSLLCDDIDLQLSTMVTFSDLTHDAPDLIAKNIDSIIPQLLKLSRYEASMKVRIAALKCIRGLTVLPLHIIVPFKASIIRALESVLDDKKRLVRKEAAGARNEWFLLETAEK